MIKSRREMTQPPRLKISQGMIANIDKKKGSQKNKRHICAAMSTLNALNIIYPSKTNNVSAVWGGELGLLFADTYNKK